MLPPGNFNTAHFPRLKSSVLYLLTESKILENTELHLMQFEISFNNLICEEGQVGELCTYRALAASGTRLEPSCDSQHQSEVLWQVGQV